jgi:hypothetical protein
LVAASNATTMPAIVATSQRWPCLDAAVSVKVKHGSKWFTITGSCVDQAPLTSNPVRIQDKRTVFLGHAYRVHAAGEVQYSTLGGSAVASGGAFAP